MHVSVPYRMLLVMTGAQVTASVVQQAFGTLGPFLIPAFHLTKAGFGLSLTAMMFGLAGGGIFGGFIVDRFGERNATIAGGIGIFLMLSAGAAAPSYAAFVVAFFLVGATYSVISPAGGRAILGWFDKDRGWAMGIRQAGIPVGAMIGGMMLPFLALHYDYRVALFAGGALALLGTVGLPFLYREPEFEIPPARHFSQYLSGIRAIVADPRTIPFLCACMALNATQQIANGFIPLSAIVLGHAGIAVASAAFVTTQVAAVSGRLVWGWASDVVFKGNRTMPLAIVCGIASFGVVGLSIIAPANLWLLFVAAFVVGFTGSGWTTLYAAAFAEIGGVRFAGSALGLGTTINFTVGSMGPFAFGALADAFTLRASWIALAVALAIAVIPALMANRAFLGVPRVEMARIEG